MEWELEGLIARLLMLISCAGEHGCSVHELLGAIRDSLAPPRTSRDDASALPDRAASEVWKWLVRRSDVSVGKERQYNHLSLADLLAWPQPLAPAANGPGSRDAPQAQEYGADGPSFGPEDGIRIYTSEATMWETITGHAVDHKRVPRSEWLLLLGIASTKSEGILQGDLGRLVGQDKRSVPKRTDCLVKKGYIVKRTTLVRGTKTSKMWLRSLVPPLPREADSDEESTTDMNLSHSALTLNLDPVNWHASWTGPDIDYRALAKTIMAIAKHWGVIRVKDLKEKLGVVGMRWQMKVVSKICRFLNSRGAIQYVAAKLDNRVFKDCVKFTRDMTAEDWSIYMATGKRHGKSAGANEHMMNDEENGYERLNMQRAHNARLGMCPPWSLDKPLSQTITSVVRSLGSRGLSNPDIYMLTLGATFNRYLSSMTGSMSTADNQPPHLKHLQMKSEHVRTGKVASYLFYLPPAQTSETAASSAVVKPPQPGHEGRSASPDNLFGFLPATTAPTHASSSLASMCDLKLVRKQGRSGIQPRGRPLKHVEKRQVGNGGAKEPAGEVMDSETTSSKTPRLETPQPRKRPRRPESRLVASNLDPEAFRPETTGDEPATPPSTQETPDRRRARNSRKRSAPAAADDAVEGSEAESISEDDEAASKPPSSRGRRPVKNGRPRGRPTGSGRGRGRGRAGQTSPTGTTQQSPSRPWKCTKCGGSWKNDLGLKYHLEKSRSACNPSYVASSVKATPKGRRASSLKSRAASPSEGVGTASTAESDTPCPDRLGAGLEAASTPPLARGPRGGEQAANRPENAEFRTRLEMEQPTGTCLTGTVEQGSLLSSQRTYHGALLPDESTAPHQSLALAEGHIDDSATGAREDESAADKGSPKLGLDAGEAVPEPGNKQPEDEGQSDVSIRTQLPKRRLSSSDVQKKADDVGGGGSIKQKKTQRERICDLVQGILDEQDGVVMGGKSLWHAVMTAWQPDTEAPDLPSPTSRACQLALNTMIREKAVTEHWHAFRDRRGQFAKCQLILRPGIDPFSPESMRLVDMAKDAQSPLKGPSQADDSDDADSSGRNVRLRGRRLLAKEVAVLDAPVYAAQVAAKRAAEAAAGSPHRPKRAKYSMRRTRGDEEDFAIFAEPLAAQDIGFAGSEASRRLGDAADALSGTQPAMTIRFLEPNTYLHDESALGQDESLVVQQGAPLIPIDPQLTQGEENLPQPSRIPPHPDGYVFESITPISRINGAWPDMDFQNLNCQSASFTMTRPVPNKRLPNWKALGPEIERRYQARIARTSSSASAFGPFQRFVSWGRACADVETSWKLAFVNARPGEAGPHSIFVICRSEFEGPFSGLPLTLKWPAEGQLTSTAPQAILSRSRGEVESSSDEELSHDDDVEVQSPSVARREVKVANPVNVRQSKTKRVVLMSRTLTEIPTQRESTGDAAEATEDSAELMAAFIAVRSLLGGVEKAIDWGLLMRVFPHLGLVYLRKFWADARKEQPAYISNFSRVFQERLIAALDKDELPMIDYSRPLDYDWERLIRWTVHLPRQEGFQLPQSKESLAKQYSLKQAKTVGEDWREKYFHVVSSFFARYEAVSSECGAVTVDEASRGFEDEPRLDDMVIARSWIKSFCNTSEEGYSAEQVNSRFAQLAAPSKQHRSELLREAASQLSHQRVICRKEKRPARGRPYRLNEWYASTLARMAQSSKYSEAAAFKEELDSTFRRVKAMRVPYTLSDGATMALTNLSAAGRIRLVPVDVPDIPFGFEPGNYESRKMPKSYYHFALDAVPTATYEYNEDIQVLRDVLREGPPRGGPRGESPQWIDIFGRPDVQLWSELLGAFCFAYATRGSMSIEGICSALNPLLDEFEAHLMVAWGKRTGVLTDLIDGVGTLVGDWWWLAVPWACRRTEDQPEVEARV